MDGVHNHSFCIHKIYDHGKCDVLYDVLHDVHGLAQLLSFHGVHDVHSFCIHVHKICNHGHDVLHGVHGLAQLLSCHSRSFCIHMTCIHIHGHGVHHGDDQGQPEQLRQGEEKQ